MALLAFPLLLLGLLAGDYRESAKRLAAQVECAEALYALGRFEDGLEVLKVADESRALPPEHAQLLATTLLRLGRSAEAARVLRTVRESAPGTLHALVATVTDRSGAVPASERAVAPASPGARWASTGPPTASVRVSTGCRRGAPSSPSWPPGGRSPASLVLDESWRYYPWLNFGVLVEDGVVTGITVTPFICPPSRSPKPR